MLRPDCPAASPPALQRRRVLMGATFVWALGGAAASAPAQAQERSEARIKARLTANLARFTLWPSNAFANADDPVVLCLAARTGTLAAAFNELNGVALGSRQLRVTFNPVNAASCHVLYVEAESERGASALLSAAAQAAVLTVGDGIGFARRGMIELVNVDDAMRFDVHLGRMRRAQLDLSSQALRLARRVES
jgi:hypothetical protein